MTKAGVRRRGRERKQLDTVYTRPQAWGPLVREPYPTAWQRNDEINVDSAAQAPALFACLSLISGDISKLRFKLVELQEWNGWREVESPAFSPILRKPNHFQNHIQFKESWVLSKLSRGNTYVLKQRDDRNIVKAMYVLDPLRVTPLVSDSGEVFYRLKADNLAGVTGDEVVVPASEIIHDRFNCLFHPLVGLSPIFASGLSTMQSLEIQRNNTKFFKNASVPGGVLTAPGRISDDLAKRMQREWEDGYTGLNAGRIAVLGDGMTFEPMRMTAADSQMIEQLKWTAEIVASTFHVPAYKINVGAVPSSNNVEALDSQYYTQCLQKLIEAFEVCLDQGLGLDTPKDGRRMGVELDLKGLLRMDTGSKVKALREAVGGGIMSPDEARAEMDLPPVKGGNSPYLQEQNYSLAALAKRDAQADPWAPLTPPPPPPPAPAPPDEDEEDLESEDLERVATALLSKDLANVDYA